MPGFEARRFLYLRRESNSNLWFRKPLFYPLNYRGIGFVIVFEPQKGGSDKPGQR